MTFNISVTNGRNYFFYDLSVITDIHEEANSCMEEAEKCFYLSDYCSDFTNKDVWVANWLAIRNRDPYGYSLDSTTQSVYHSEGWCISTNIFLDMDN